MTSVVSPLYYSYSSYCGRLLYHSAYKYSLSYSPTPYPFQCFEGMKAYKDKAGKIRMFRPDMNMKRFLRSTKRLTMAVCYHLTRGYRPPRTDPYAIGFRYGAVARVYQATAQGGLALDSGRAWLQLVHSPHHDRYAGG